MTTKLRDLFTSNKLDRYVSFRLRPEHEAAFEQLQGKLLQIDLLKVSRGMFSYVFIKASERKLFTYPHRLPW